MIYSFLFLSLATLLSYTGFISGGLWHLLHWASLDCFLLSLGYAGIGPKIFAKHPDGSIPIWVRLVYIPFTIYIKSFWHLSRLMSRESPMNRVNADLIIGRRLLRDECPDNIVNYIDLTAEFEDPAWIRSRTHYINLPVLDASVPRTADLLNTIAMLHPGLTYVHCAQGHGRTGLFTLVLLAEQDRIGSFKEGMTLLKKVRPKISLNKTQERFVRNFINDRWGRKKPAVHLEGEQ